MTESKSHAYTLTSKARECFSSKLFKLAIANFTFALESLEKSKYSDNRFYTCILQDLVRKCILFTLEYVEYAWSLLVRLNSINQRLQQAISKFAAGLHKEALGILQRSFRICRGLPEVSSLGTRFYVKSSLNIFLHSDLQGVYNSC